MGCRTVERFLISGCQLIFHFIFETWGLLFLPRATFTKPDGSYYKQYELIKRPLLARSYEQIAENPMAMYEEDSQLSQDFLADVKEIGNISTLFLIKTFN